LTEHNGTKLSLGDVISGAALVAVVIVTVRVIRVAHGIYPTELALIEQEKTLSVIFGSVAPVIPYLTIYLAALLVVWMFQSRRRQSVAEEQLQAIRNASTTSDRKEIEPPRDIVVNSGYLLFATSVTAIVVVFVTTSIGELLFASIAVAALFGVVAAVIKWQRMHKARWLPPPIPEGQRWQTTALLMALAVFLVVQLGFDDSMWTPAELVTVAHQPQIVYVLGSSGPNTEAILASSRKLVQFPTSALMTSRLCNEQHAKLGLEVILGRWPSIYQLATGEHGQLLVSCQTLISTEGHIQKLTS
jgi:hypothetical protein